MFRLQRLRTPYSVLRWILLQSGLIQLPPLTTSGYPPRLQRDLFPPPRHQTHLLDLLNAASLYLQSAVCQLCVLHPPYQPIYSVLRTWTESRKPYCNCVTDKPYPFYLTEYLHKATNLTYKLFPLLLTPYLQSYLNYLPTYLT
jgi:hypothetical protein